ncbi:hypothetical protein SMICM304S_10083 [Streptomyces microflavus]
MIPKTGPTAAATEDTVHAIRDRVAGVQGADIALTGVTAVGIDVSEKLAAALPVYLLLVVGLSVLLLMLVFRSVPASLPKAALVDSCSPSVPRSASPSRSSRKGICRSWSASTPPGRW